MPRVQRSNVILTVSEEEVPFYIRKGYNLTSPTGEILQAAVPNDMATLQKAYADQTREINELKAKVSRLTVELEQAKHKEETKRKKKTE